jgi:hypothetical protein
MSGEKCAHHGGGADNLREHAELTRFYKGVVASMGGRGLYGFEDQHGQ